MPPEWPKPLAQQIPQPRADFVNRRGETLRLAGFATPEATLESFYWGNISGDIYCIAACMASPERQASMQRQFSSKSPEEIQALIAERTRSLTEFRILDRTNYPNGKTAFAVYYDSFEIMRPITMEKIAGEWKITSD
jgi:hypothetical protein